MTGDPTDSIFNFSISAIFKPFFNAKEIKSVQQVRVHSTHGQPYCWSYLAIHCKKINVKSTLWIEIKELTILGDILTCF